MAVSEFVRLDPDDRVEQRRVRYRTVGDMTCTAAVESEAADIEVVISEIQATRISERGETRSDDKVTEAAMEDRSQRYFDLFRYATDVCLTGRKRNERSLYASLTGFARASVLRIRSGLIFEPYKPFAYATHARRADRS